MAATSPYVDGPARVSQWVRPAALTVVLVALLTGAVLLALRESASATTAPGVLVSVDHRDGGNSGTGVVTVQYVDGTGKRVTAQVVMTLSRWTSLDPGTAITVFVRDGRAVDEPDPLLPMLALNVLQAGLLWLVVALGVREFSRGRPPSRENSAGARLDTRN